MSKSGKRSSGPASGGLSKGSSDRSSPTVLCIGSDTLSLYHRSAFLREQGWRVLTSGSGHEGVLHFTAESVDVVVVDLNGDGAEAAVIAGELKRLRPKVPVVILVVDDQILVEGALASADAVVSRSDHSKLLQALQAS